MQSLIKKKKEEGNSSPLVARKNKSMIYNKLATHKWTRYFSYFMKYSEKDIPLKDLIFSANSLRDPKVEVLQREGDIAQSIIKSLPLEGMLNRLVVDENNQAHIGQNRLIALRYIASNKDTMTFDEPTPLSDAVLSYRIIRNLTWDTPIPCYVIYDEPTPYNLKQFYRFYSIWDSDDENIRKPMVDEDITFTLV